jgi:hypothetical protein
MAINDSKKPLLLGMSTEEVIQSSDANFTSLFDSIDDLDQNIKNSGFVTRDVDNLVNYTLNTKTGTSILLSIDKDYVMTLQLKNEAGTVVSTSSIDFPIESMIIDASYANGTLTLTLQNGNSIDVDISAIISGLVPDSRKINNKPLSADVTLTQDDIGEGTSYKRYSSTEKTKLAGIDEGANRYVHPSYTARPNALYKITVDNTGHISEVTPVTKQDITALGIPAQDTRYPLATESTSGLMSSVDKKKLNAIDPSLEGVTADEIGKVKDVKVNGTSVLNSEGVAVVTIEELNSGYVSIVTTDSRWTTQTVNGTVYQAIKVEKTNTAIEVYNASGQRIVAQNVFDDSYLYICVGTAKIACTLRTIGGQSLGGSIGVYQSGISKTITLPSAGLYEVVLVGYASSVILGWDGHSRARSACIIDVDTNDNLCYVYAYVSMNGVLSLIERKISTGTETFVTDAELKYRKLADE